MTRELLDFDVNSLISQKRNFIVCATHVDRQRIQHRIVLLVKCDDDYVWIPGIAITSGLRLLASFVNE